MALWMHFSGYIYVYVRHFEAIVYAFNGHVSGTDIISLGQID